MGDSVIGTIASVAFGVLQAFLLKSVLLSFTRGRYEQAALALFLKLIFYAAAAAAVLFYRLIRSVARLDVPPDLLSLRLYGL